MSRVAKAPVEVPSGVEVTLQGNDIQVKGPKGQMAWSCHRLVSLNQEEGTLTFEPRQQSTRAVALTGTTRALVQNMVTGVSEGFERRLELKGVGYRAQVQGSTLNLTLGFSHPVHYEIPEGVTIECPSQTEVVVKGADKQQVGQVAAQIRGYRPPEPYKGKGVRYADERVVLKEAKKK
ncbi:50S ribosomal protein L6 [Halorhodospira halophila]|uniref:Large ribosomal subunit protein uL6 n=1 Tax=Halorhodospira halophila (strain DSM 244 / SL1) TaxID=349124 RepID=RL6_HALHL|nr:50S ribosomal protein L6 [Halorhodospira halophila]A1WVA7.1 RecName: Full=Large ribosomal subunit protein uL6; AltName: Full=50S ribosomal protein L6 [Halorhodospira halophila SL1]ABM61619.1 LSU ribosomal protein L6P [Halorhodospira halophila SL1]MBK1729923.1 50S ribosomal protein L6 [Halorhodospira halophila]